MTPSSSVDPYALLGLPRAYDLDPAALQRAFIQASASNHPDRFDDPDEQQAAAERIAQINAAHAALKDPESRANLLLDLLGGPSAAKDHSLPPNLLVEMLEIRDQIQDAHASADPAALNELSRWAADRRKELLASISAHFQKALAGPAAATDDASVAQLAAIRMDLNALRYIQRALDQSSPDYRPTL